MKEVKKQVDKNQFFCKKKPLLLFLGSQPTVLNPSGFSRTGKFWSAPPLSGTLWNLKFAFEDYTAQNNIIPTMPVLTRFPTAC